MDDLPQGAQEADGTDNLVRAVREQIGRGADVVKVYADYRWGPGGTYRAHVFARRANAHRANGAQQRAGGSGPRQHRRGDAPRRAGRRRNH
ncbi:MAG: hypothetical protein WKG07_13530 [Hymenobacter sp.]